MREALAALWNSVILTLTTFNRTIATVDNYAKWAEAESAAFEEEARIEREARLAILSKQLELT